MAKLNGVKSIDMVNGEITKISYKGAEYVLNEGPSHKGDVVLVKKAWGSQSVGEFFEDIANDHALYTREGDYVFIHGNTCVASAPRGNVDVFRKTSASQALESRVDEIDKRVSALEKPEATPLKVGDKVRLLSGGGNYPLYGFTNGAEYVVEDLECGTLTKISGGYGPRVGFATREQLENAAPSKPEPAQTITHDGEEYTLVDRKAQSGDVVYVTEDAESTDAVPHKAQYIVEDGGRIDGYRVYTDSYSRTEETVLVYERAVPKIKVGDIVVITANTNSSGNKVGDIGRVVDDYSDGDNSVRVSVKGRRQTSNFTKFTEMRLATESERKAFEIDSSDLKVGDFVEVIDYRDSRYSDFENGTVGEITDIDPSFSHAIRVVTDDDFDRFNAKALRKVEKPKRNFKAGEFIFADDPDDGQYYGVIVSGPAGPLGGGNYEIEFDKSGRTRIVLGDNITAV